MDRRETTPEITDALHYHGGNLTVARRLFPSAPQPWIDLSTGINALPYPVGETAPSAWTRLPEPSELLTLEQVARAAYGAGMGPDVVAGPGTQSLIQWLPRLVHARRVGVVGPTYGEHERSWRDAGAAVEILADLSDCARCDVVVCVNPNNPDGRLLAPDRLAAAASDLAQSGGLLVVDEAFVDVLGWEHSLVPMLPDSGVLVLRSFGKTYGLAGLRLGFAVTSPELGARLRAALGQWAVSGPAIFIGRRALADSGWLAQTAARLGRDANRLDGMLRAAGFEIVGGTPLFRLARHPLAARKFEDLGQAGILTRPFRHRQDWLRFGIPGQEEDWERLGKALAG